MPRRPFTPALLVLATLLVPGCLTGDGDGAASPGATEDAPEPGTVVVDTGSPLDEATPDGAGSRAHQHDSWGDRTEVTLVDAEFEPRFPCAFWRRDRPTEPARLGCVFVEMGTGTIVYQGTAKLTLTATWSDPRVTGLHMGWTDAQGAHDDMVPVKSGATVEIPVTLETADMPHSTTSKWFFALFGGSDAGTGFALDTVHIRIVIHRGLDLPVDPPHPDFWANGTTLPVLEASGTLKAPRGSSAYPLSTEVDIVLPPRGRLVPPGTTMLVADFTWRIVDPAPGVVYRVMPYYYDGTDPFWNRPQDMELSGSAGSFTLEVEPTMTDSPYADTSKWRFTLLQYHEAPATGLDLPTGLLGSTPLHRDIEYTMRVVAHGSTADMA